MNFNEIIKKALEEDLGLGDVTTDNLFDEKHKSTAKIIAKQNMVLCGCDVAKEVFLTVDKTLKIKQLHKDGDFVVSGTMVFQISGKTKSILHAERTALNFLQRLSGIATKTRKFVKVAKKYGVKICDTRKSMPGFRYLDKYAVRCGGGFNHRMNLADSVLIKDNHIKACGSISKAVKTLQAKVPHTAKIEVETKTITEVKQALGVKADIIMLDNMTPKQILRAKKIIGKKAIVEVSGGITLENLEQFAKTKPNVISVGALTHSVTSSDLSLNIK